MHFIQIRACKIDWEAPYISGWKVSIGNAMNGKQPISIGMWF